MDAIPKPLDMKYRPHSARYTCVSLLVEAKVDQTTIKKIAGYRGAMALTESVYTHLDTGALIKTVNSMYRSTR